MMIWCTTAAQGCKRWCAGVVPRYTPTNRMEQTIVVTGSSRGIGFGLAVAFLEVGHNVVVCGRTDNSTSAAVDGLAARFGHHRLLGVAADVAQFEQVGHLWTAAVERFGRVHIWINNAGLGARPADAWERSPEEMAAVVSTNPLGVMHGCAVAVTGMLEQGGGFIYNMEGLGSRGPVVSGTALYAASKAGVTRFTRGLVKETAHTPVRVGFMSPGMVITDLFTGPDQEAMTPGAKKIANILADRVETVAPYLAGCILSNTKHGAHVDWLPGRKIAWRFATAPFRRNRLFTIN